MRVMHRKRRDLWELGPSVFGCGPQHRSLHETNGCHRNGGTDESMQIRQNNKTMINNNKSTFTKTFYHLGVKRKESKGYDVVVLEYLCLFLKIKKKPI